MKLQFTIPYHTKWGEEIGVEMTLWYANQRSKQELYTLSTQDGELWQGEIVLETKTLRRFSYCYVVTTEQKIVRREWQTVPRSFNADLSKDFCLFDHWRDTPALSWLYTNAFSKVISPRSIESSDHPYFHRTLLLNTSAPQLKKGEALGIIGNHVALGKWNPTQLLRMTERGLHQWSISLSFDGLTLPLEYKYVIIDAQTHQLLTWEEGDNRVIHDCTVAPNQILVVTDDMVRAKEEQWKGAGVVIPLFSLRSKKSYGIGDFGDLRTMIDWIALNKLQALQLLPINDTTISHTWHDSYPYNSISIYAIHPQYIDLNQLNHLKDVERMNYFDTQQTHLNALDKVDYESVNKIKRSYLYELYLQEGSSCLTSENFNQYFAIHQEWLTPYAAFSLFRDKYQTADFTTWPTFKQFDRIQFEQYCQINPEDWQQVNYYYYVQFLLHTQLSNAHEYAQKKGVILKGDIPIGISRHSVEAWVESDYFNMDAQAGAPPDDFSETGQNWGFPTYNWQVMKQDGYRWWAKRFQKMSAYFDAYRIDHILGFFRIWEIPTTAVNGLLGQFSPALPLSESEIMNYGLRFRQYFMTNPYISDESIKNTFGAYADYVKKNFLHATPFGLYDIKPEYNTQRKIEQLFADKHDEESCWVRDGLYHLLCNVLFVEDHRNPQHYHPRINAQKTSIYQTLNTQEQAAFDKLHEDFYYHRHNDFWYHEAMNKLPTLLQTTDMLACAEDLGMVPDCVPWAMNELRILTLEIETMPKQYGVEFGRLEQNPYSSISTIFTHDMPTLREWWEEDYTRTQRFYHNVLCKTGDAPVVITASLCEEIVTRHLHSPSMFTLISWQDWLSIDEQLRRKDIQTERINVPSNPNNNWNYRMHITIEELMEQKALNQKIRKLVIDSGRAQSETSFDKQSHC